MKIGRNDPCPCGSGKKFKKCCIDKPEYRQPVAVPSRGNVNFKDLFSLTDRLSRDDLRKVKTSVLSAKGARLDKIEKQRLELDKLSTDDLLNRLGDAGVAVDVKSFVETAGKLHTSLQLSETWDGQEWRPFAFAAAADVLWDRLCPDCFRYEAFGRLMEEGYRFAGPESYIPPKACEPWHTAWIQLARFAPEAGYTDIEQLDEVSGRYVYDIPSDWVQDFETELGNTALDHPECAETLLTFTRDFCRLFPNSDSDTLFNMQCAEGDALFLLNKPDEGDAHFEALIRDHPTNVLAYTHWGDNYVPRFGNPAPYENPAKARAIYERGLAAVTEFHKGLLEDRLEDVAKVE